jgi:selenocysteine-specific elongation factor
VDRSFTLKGIGTVITGTLWSGSVATGDTVRILPRGLEARVRSVQVHDRPLERAAAGQRVALNLSGVGWRELGRGDVVSSPAAELEPTYLVDAELSLEDGAEPLRRGERLHVHHGTREAPARVVPLGEDFAQLRLEAPLVPAAGDRLVLRRLAPPDTVGGGVVVDAHPRKHGPGAEVVERLHALRRGDPLPEPEAPREEVPPPEPTPLDEAALRLASLLRSDGERPRTDAELAAAAGLEAVQAGRRLRALEHAGQAVRVGRNLHFDPEALDRIISRVLAICEREGAATIAGVRDELGTSRKYAQVVLEHLDAAKITRRRGDEHVVR